MAVLTNTDSVEGTDRQAIGPKQDNSRPDGGDNVVTPGAPPTGPAGGDLAGSYPNPEVAAIHETTGPAKLTIGAVADGQFLKRSGTALIGSAPGTGDVVGPASAADGDFAQYDTTTGKLIKDGGYAPSSFDPNGAAAAAYAAAIAAVEGGSLNAWFAYLKLSGSLTLDPVLYPGGGVIQIRFDLGAFADVGLVSAPSFSPAGSTGMVAGRQQMIVLRNTTGGALALTWPGAWVVAGAPLPTSLAAGKAIRLFLSCEGTVETSIAVTWVPNILGFTNPMTTLGDLIYGDTGGAPTRLAGNIVEKARYLRSKGSGVFAAAPAWGNLPWYFVSEYASLQDALDAAAANHGCLMLDPGITDLPAAGLALPAGFTGQVAIRGQGKKVTKLRQSTAAPGIVCDLSTGTVRENSVHLADFSLLANNSGCTTAIEISYGTTGYNSEILSGSSLRGIELIGGSGGGGQDGWINGFSFVNCWHLSGDDLYAYGGAATFRSGAGGGTGAAFIFSSCFNCQFGKLTAEFFQKGTKYTTAYANGGCQGILIDNFITVEVCNAIHALAGSSDACGTLQYNNILFDNGNSHPSGSGAYLTILCANIGELVINGGQVLQLDDVYQAEFDDCTGIMINAVDFSYFSSGSAVASIHWEGSTNDSSTTGCKFADGIDAQLAEAGTANITEGGNSYGSGGNTDSNSSFANHLGKTLGKSYVPAALTGGVAFEDIQLDISEAKFGRKPEGLTVQVIDGGNFMTYSSVYRLTDGSTDKNTAVVRVWKTGGGNTGADTLRLSVVANP